jgi:hypothetical protein
MPVTTDTLIRFASVRIAPSTLRSPLVDDSEKQVRETRELYLADAMNGAHLRA